jgi:hypothetical protein
VYVDWLTKTDSKPAELAVDREDLKQKLEAKGVETFSFYSCLLDDKKAHDTDEL